MSAVIDAPQAPDELTAESAMAATQAVSDDADAGTSNDDLYVTFQLGDEMFAVQMAPVQEIIRVPTVSHLPLAPRALDGLANLRGRVLPIVNLRRIFGAPERPLDDASRAVVIQLGQPLGFVVDRVASVVRAAPEELESADAIQSTVSADYLTGVIKRARGDGTQELLLTVDFERLIAREFHVADSAGASHDGPVAGAVNRSAEPREAEAVQGEELRLVSFTVAGQEYAIHIEEVQEIVQLPERISAVPNAPGHVLGLISLRERLLPLVSLRRLFCLPDLGHQEQHRIVVIAVPGGRQIGLVTDAVKEVLSVPRTLADDMPTVMSNKAEMSEFSSICRLDDGKRLVSILAIDRLLGTDSMQQALSATADHLARHDAGTDSSDSSESTMNHSDDDTAVTEDDTQVVIFRLGSEEFGVPITAVQEIVRVPESLTRVPMTPSFVEGVINLRGTVLPVIDQRKRLGMPTEERSDRQRIMVYLLDGVRTGFIVDSVAEVLRIPRSQIETAPDLSAEQRRLIRRVAKLAGDQRLVMLIDPDALLRSDELSELAAGEAATA